MTPVSSHNALRVVAVFWLAAVMLALGYLGWRMTQGLHFRADLMTLMPREDISPAIAAANDKVTDQLSRRVVLLVGDPSREAARDAASRITAALVRAGMIVPMTQGLDSDALKRIGAAYYPYRAGLLSANDRALLEANRGGDIATRAMSQVFGVGSLPSAALLKTDPFLLMPSYLASLPLPRSRLTLNDGFLGLHDDGMNWILIGGTLKGSPYSLDVQKTFTAELDDAMAQARSHHPELKLLRTGAVFYAKVGAESALNETSMIGLVSIVLTVLLLIVAFRSPYPLLLSLAVIGVGLTVALSVSLWWWGELHVMALLFGVSLIGITVDYSLHYFSEIYAPDTGNAFERMRHVLPGISLGGATTAAGYLLLLLAPFPGLRQIAFLSAIGLAAAWLSAVLWLPILDRMKAPARAIPLQRTLALLPAFWDRKPLHIVRLAVFALLAGICAFGATQLHADDDVRNMQALSASLQAEQHRIQAYVGAVGDSQFFVVQAPDEETALQREEALSARLKPLIASGALDGYQALAGYVPSLKRQAENRRLIAERLYRPHLAEQAALLGFTPPQQPQGPGMTPDKLPPLGFLSLLRVSDTATDTVHVVTLNGVTDATAVARAASGIDGIRFINPTTDYSRLFGKYRERATALLALSALVIFLMLAVRYGMRRTSRIIAPSLLAVAATPFIAATTGAAFTFFDVIALVLVLSVGTDYAVFYAETDARRRSTTLFAIAISACTTIMSFGFLALSNAMAVHNFGLTMLIGVSLSFAFTPMIKGLLHERHLP